MNLAKISEMVNTSLKEEDFIPISKLKDKKFTDRLKSSYSLPTYEEIEKFAKKLDEHIERFFINTKLLTPIIIFTMDYFLKSILMLKNI